MSADIGVIGLAVMGQNLILNIHDHGFKVVAFNRTVEKVDRFMENEAKGTGVIGARSLQEFVSHLKSPRRILLMVKAGEAVDEFISHLLPLLAQGDIIIDGGNSLYTDTQRRCIELEKKGFLFVGTGVSGGEEGARYGPSLMPGGSPGAWPHLCDIFQSIAAKTTDGRPCCEWVGHAGSGHFVKMVHNGIEYGDMQLIAEAYHIAKAGLKLNAASIVQLFNDWKSSELNSFLIDITADIVAYQDADGTPLVEKIRDAAGQKGTGKWTVIASLDFGVPATLVAEAVFARSLSAAKKERVQASQYLKGPEATLWPGSLDDWRIKLRQALYAAKIISYGQGFRLLQQASIENEWHLNFAGIAQMWQGGCIIRSVFLDRIRNAFLTDSSSADNLLLDPFFLQALTTCSNGWRNVVSQAVLTGIPTPALSTALAYYDGLRCPNLPANLIQAQRDYFGAHTYELESNPGMFLHTNWTGRGGNVSSSDYKG